MVPMLRYSFRAISGASVPGRQDCAQSIVSSKVIGHLPFAFSPPNLGFGGIVAPAQFCCTGHNDIE
jgi:hypothetical protein